MNEALLPLAEWLRLAVPWITATMLGLARTSALFLALPQFTIRGIPRESKSIVVLCLAALIAWRYGSMQVPTSIENFEFAKMLILEFVYGFMMGFIINIAIATVRTTGQIIGIEMGLSFAAIADPLSQNQGTVLSTLFGALAVQIFILLGLDREMIWLLFHSFDAQPLGQVQFSSPMYWGLLALGEQLFLTAVEMAIPIMGTIFSLKLSMAFLARIAPKLQIFSLAFILTLFVGHIVLFFAIPSIGHAVAQYLQESLLTLREFTELSGHVR